MALLLFDTHEFVTKLTDAGIPAEQAEAISSGLQGIDLKYVATREDVARLEKDIEVKMAKLDAKIEAMG